MDGEPTALSSYERLVKNATNAAVVVAILLILLKFGAFLNTNSVAVLSSLIDSCADAASSLVLFFAVRHSLTPPDREHRFGHGKAEPLAALALAAFVAGSALFLAIEGISRLLHPMPVEHAMLGVVVMALSIAITLTLTTFQRYVVQRTGSTAISADRLHYLMDVVVNLGIIVGLVLTATLGWGFADPLIALLVAAWMLRGAWNIITPSLGQLMDRELDDAQRGRIESICLAEAEVNAVHDLRTRQSGKTAFIQLHLELDGDLSLLRAHAIALGVHNQLLVEFPDAEIIIHQDPADDAQAAQ